MHFNLFAEGRVGDGECIFVMHFLLIAISFLRKRGFKQGELESRNKFVRQYLFCNNGKIPQYKFRDVISLNKTPDHFTWQ